MRIFTKKIKCVAFILLCLGSSVNTQAQWIQRGNDIDGEAAGDNSGSSVSLSSDGNILAIGALGNDETGDLAGHVRVYTWNGTAWTQRGSDIDGEAAEDRSGWSVSLSSDGNILAIGARLNDGTGEDAGHVRVYTWNGTVWTQLGDDIDGEAAGDASGGSVSLSADGNTLAIGALGNDEAGDLAGHVRVYTWNGAAWTQRGNDIDGEAEGDFSGRSVSLSSDGNTLAIGAIGNDDTGDLAGHVRVYTWNGTAWAQRGSDIDGEAAGDVSGGSVSLSSDGNILAIGATNNDGTGDLAGHVRVYTWNGAAWTQRGDDIDGEAADDRSGGSVSLSSDGNTLAIGATNNDGTDPAAGHVRVYTWNGTAWIQRGSDIDGEARPDQSGGSVSLAADGNTLAIGAARNSGTGAVSGHVRVYEFPFVEIDLKQGSTAIASGETYDFGELATNTSSAEVEFTLENTGNADLELSGTVGNLVVLSGTDADQFLVSQTDVTSPIAAGSEKDFTVSFAPTSEGEKTATLIITSNDTDEGIYTLNLSGNALIPSIPEINLRQSNTTIASGETYDFGELATNTSSTEIDFTLENTGDADLELSGTAGSLVVLAGTDADQFSLSQSDIISPIAAGSNQTFTLSFSPTSEGEKMATLTITSDDADEGTYILNLGGIGVAPLIPEPEINLRQDTTTIASGETYDFGEVDTNTSSSEVAFILENIGDADLEFSGTAGSLVALSGTDADQFSVSQTQVTSPLAAGSDQTFTVSFSPTSEGEKTATLTITSNDADEGTYTLNLSGTSVAVQVGNPEINLRQGNTAIASGETYDFGEVDTNTSSDEVSFTLENAGTADLVLSGVAGSLIVLAGTGADQFSVNQTDIISPITADSSQTFTVTFSPTSEGEKTATLVITSNDADEGTYTFNLSGIGVLPGSPEPEINLRQGTTTIASGETYDFGEVDTNTSSSEVAFILENIGDADLELSGTAGSLVALSGTDADQFSIDQTQVTSPLTAGSDQTFTVSFSPTSEGGKTATLTIISNDADEGTYTLNLSGTGIEIITSLLSTEKESMMVYPNPTRDRVIAKNLPLGKNSFVLTDVLGNTILAGETSNTLELDMSGLTAGTYTLTFTTGEQVFIKKILKY